MANHVLLNNITHKDVKIVTEHSAQFGDDVSGVITFPTEFGDVQQEYPILFQKNADTEEYQSVAMLGIKHNENLYLNKDGWNASYIPAIVERGPFLIGFQDQSADGGDEYAAVVHIDMDSPRISNSLGERVFSEYGGNSPYLERINTVLKGINDGLAVSDAMFSAFESLDLIEPISLEIKLNNGELHRLHGNYTISREKLAALSGENLAKLNASGFLEGAFLVLASLNNIKKLVGLKNSRP
ncbi:MAG: SapC family protein [Pseudomonadales bacterium]